MAEIIKVDVFRDISPRACGHVHIYTDVSEELIACVMRMMSRGVSQCLPDCTVQHRGR